MTSSNIVQVTVAGRTVGGKVPKHNVLMMENTDFSTWKSTSTYSYALALKYGICTGYVASNPCGNGLSLPEYLDLFFGDNYGICVDEAPSGHGLAQKSIAESCGDAGLSWAAYAEDLPRSCFLGGSVGNYAGRHVPALFSGWVTGTPANCDKVQAFTFDPLTVIDPDNMPSYSMTTPNVLNDAHNTSIAYADTNFNKYYIAELMAGSDFQNNNLAIWFICDNATSSPGGLTIGAVFWKGLSGPVVVSAKRNHFDTLHEIEKQIGLPYLTAHDSAATGFPEFFP